MIAQSALCRANAPGPFLLSRCEPQDGGSWTGNVKAPVKTATGATIYYRGRPLLDGLLDYMLAAGCQSRNAHQLFQLHLRDRSDRQFAWVPVKDADHLLYGGCSAGGLTAYLHTDYVASRMPTTVKTLGIADAMYSLDVPGFKNTSAFPHTMQWGHEAWNSSGSGNDACEAHYKGGLEWMCFFGQNTAPFVKTPLFVLNSKYDSWQGPAIIGASGAIATCPADVQKYWVAYGQKMVDNALALPPQHGAFLSNCGAHCQTGGTGWAGTTVNGTAMGSAFVQWYTAHASGSFDATTDATKFKWAEQCDVMPCAPDKCG